MTQFNKQAFQMPETFELAFSSIPSLLNYYQLRAWHEHLVATHLLISSSQFVIAINLADGDSVQPNQTN